MVTLFTPDYGRIDAIARGCRRPKSALVNCVEPFVSGEFQLYARRERYTIEQCQIRESFYELRTDYDRLIHGVYWLKLLECAVMPEEANPELFMMALRALAHLNYSDLPPELLTMAFEMHLLASARLCAANGRVRTVRETDRRRCAVRCGARRRSVPELPVECARR